MYVYKKNIYVLGPEWFQVEELIWDSNTVFMDAYMIALREA